MTRFFRVELKCNWIQQNPGKTSIQTSCQSRELSIKLAVNETKKYKISEITQF